MNPPTPDQITIAVTVYDRRKFIQQSTGSAVVQTVPVPVMVVEDAGPDSGLRQEVEARFGQRVRYLRNQQRRGLFDNWNACLEACETPWLSILHDDDWLEPDFVSVMLELARQAPGAGLYYGQTRVVGERGERVSDDPAPWDVAWRPMDLASAAVASPFPFPGQLFHVPSARALGGFRATSRFTGDWEMWFNLGLRYGAAQAGRVVANFRKHRGPGRGTTRVERTGEVYGRVAVQQKQNLARLRDQAGACKFNRSQPPFDAPWVTTLLLRNGAGMSSRMLRYNRGLLLVSTPARGWMHPYRAFARLAGLPGMRLASRLWRLLDSGIASVLALGRLRT